MISVNTHEAKSNLSRLLSEVESKHESIKICRNGKPVAMLTPIQEIADPLEQHSQLMGVKFYENPDASSDDNQWPEGMKKNHNQ